VLADFLVAEAQRLLARAEALVSSIEATRVAPDVDTGQTRQGGRDVAPRPEVN
jgi:hypothetical protein